MSTQHATTQLAEAVRLMREGLNGAAERRCRQAIQADPGFAPAHHVLAVMLAGGGRIIEALEPARRACALAPDRVEALLNLAEIEMHLGDFDTAATRFEEAIRRGADGPQSRSRLAICQQSSDQYEAACDNYERALSMTDGDADLHFNHGTALKRLSRFDASKNAFRRACTLAPDAVDGWLALGILQVEIADYADGITSLEQVLRLDPENTDAHSFKSYAHLKLGQPQAALAATREYRRLSPDAPGALAGMSAAAVATGDPELALECCARLLTLDPGNRNALADSAIALSSLGRIDEAIRLVDLDRVLRNQQLIVPEGFGSIEAFNQAIITHLQSHPKLSLDCLSVSCHNGYTSNEILVEPLGPMALLKAAITEAAERYKAEVSLPPGHPFTTHMPASWELGAWMTRLRSQGYQHGHIHSTAYLSGVYYLQLPDSLGQRPDDQAGWIEFGRAPYYYGEGDQGEIRAIRPQPGTLLLFPSYVFHRTLPFSGDTHRITIAFDFQPR